MVILSLPFLLVSFVQGSQKTSVIPTPEQSCTSWASLKMMRQQDWEKLRTNLVKLKPDSDASLVGPYHVMAWHLHAAKLRLQKLRSSRAPFTRGELHESDLS